MARRSSDYHAFSDSLFKNIDKLPRPECLRVLRRFRTLCLKDLWFWCLRNASSGGMLRLCRWEENHGKIRRDAQHIGSCRLVDWVQSPMWLLEFVQLMGWLVCFLCISSFFCLASLDVYLVSFPVRYRFARHARLCGFPIGTFFVLAISRWVWLPQWASLRRWGPLLGLECFIVVYNLHLYTVYISVPIYRHYMMF